MLSNEEREKLSRVKPSNLAAASRISGITPASLISLHKYLLREKKYNKAS